ncbi:hypothetical protein IFM89_029588 [Coptis chinensis]|uniref:Uncharacterized protein n=1 Tax=Coptis chinensis TaxID=261450 RepID=A0A835IFS4_9MAGN|nr:hypothetical protein IFM89_023015 [Coptis chinensis]KAF9616334.1 hypothetical protein IFM89_029588 [Coptis chinensis]
MVMQRYNKDAKVVVKCEEGRSPHIGRDGVSSFELHQSHFSLEWPQYKGQNWGCWEQKFLSPAVCIICVSGTTGFRE